MSKLSAVIRGRPVFVLVPGASLVGLEDTIEDYRNKDICWVSLNCFDIIEKYLLSKINRHLDIVLVCAGVNADLREYYETTIRFPLLTEFLERKEDNLWVTTRGLIRDSVKPYGSQLLKYESKIQLIDDIYPQDDLNNWVHVANSLVFLLAAVLSGGASKIFIFGMDGYLGDLNKSADSYYRPEEQTQARLLTLGEPTCPHLINGTKALIKELGPVLDSYRKIFRNMAPIYNVSPITVYSTPEKIEYSQVRELL